MKRFFLFAGLALVMACGSETNEESGNKGDSSIVEIQENDKSSQITNAGNNNTTSQQQAVLDSKFEMFLNKFKKVDLPYKIVPKKELDGDKIPFESQVNYLSKAEGLDRNELDQMQDYAKFYYLSHPIGTNTFNAIVYARFEMGSSYYILCTFDNSGKLISFIDFAMYQLIGAGPQAGQEYEMSGSIDKNMTITTVADQETKNYQINTDGKIVKK